MANSDAELVRRMEKQAVELIACKPECKEVGPAIGALDELLIQAWKRHWE